MLASLTAASGNLREALADAGRGLVEREILTELIGLAAVAGEHMLVIGSPGTAKSTAVRRVAKALGGSYFEYLLGRFTEPNELFGPIDLRKLKEGVVEIHTTGMLPEAEFVFLDEVFLGSTAILNTLLNILHERRFRRGHTHVECPLRICVGASNGLPEDESLSAFADRFLVHLFIEPIADARLEELLEGGWSLEEEEISHFAAPNDLDLLADVAQAADLGALRPQLAQAFRLLRKAGVTLSDRRLVKAQKLVAAAAALAGRESPTAADLWPILYTVPTAEGQQLARDVLGDLLHRSENRTLSAAAADASLGPVARAQRIFLAGEAALNARPSENDPDLLASWQLKLESIGREIDATFSIENMPDNLKGLRERIVAEAGNPS